jgi:hypothetical protein
MAHILTTFFQRLRYKLYQQVKKEEVDQRRLNIPPGEVLELDSIKEFARICEKDEELGRWWKEAMGFATPGDARTYGIY